MSFYDASLQLFEDVWVSLDKYGHSDEAEKVNTLKKEAKQLLSQIKTDDDAKQKQAIDRFWDIGIEIIKLAEPIMVCDPQTGNMPYPRP